MMNILVSIPMDDNAVFILRCTVSVWILLYLGIDTAIKCNYLVAFFKFN